MCLCGCVRVNIGTYVRVDMGTYVRVDMALCEGGHGIV